LASLPEPANWTVSGNVDAASTATFLDRVGRFGLYSNHGQSNRTVVFDDFRASFFEGSLLGDPAGSITPALPLRRSKASYRTCTPEVPCGAAEGCCFDASECASGLTCSAQQAEYGGVGSHARICAPEHCTDQLLNSDELRADCGGSDCAPCACNTAGTPGGGGYCTDACRCGIGGTDCTTSSNCLAGLICGQEKGYKFGWAQGTDACLPSHCVDRVQSGDETGVDTGGSCGSVVCFPSANGGYQHCTPSCPCPKGEGNVNYKDECQGALVVGVGARWGYAFDVCVEPHCANNVQDADETGKDCGGVDCGPICPP